MIREFWLISVPKKRKDYEVKHTTKILDRFSDTSLKKAREEFQARNDFLKLIENNTLTIVESKEKIYLVNYENNNKRNP